MLNEKNRKHIEVNGVLFLATFQAQIYGDDNEPLLEYGDKWRLEKASYHKSTWMRPLKRKKSQQIPRWKTIGYYDTFEEAKAICEQLTRCAGGGNLILD